MTSGAATERRADARAVELSRLYLDALRAGDGARAEDVARRALAEGLGLATVYHRVITPALWEIGALWGKGELSVSEEHLATALTQRVMAFAYASVDAAPPRAERILLAAMEGQRHDIGLRMAADLLEVAGFETDYLGPDVPAGDLMFTALGRSPDLVALSITIPSGVAGLKRFLGELTQRAPRMPVVVGGRGIPGDAAEWGARPVDDLERTVPTVEELLRAQPAQPPGPRPVPVTKLPERAQKQVGRDAHLAEMVAGTAELARREARRARRYRSLAYEDPVSLLPNRRSFDDRLSDLGSEPGAFPVALLMIDIDDFKQVNDERGHDAGDAVLLKVAQAIRAQLREGDFAARFGGDEFGVVLPRTEGDAAAETAERVRAAIEAGTGVTASIGISGVLPGGSRHAVLEADEALYAAKESGRNAVRVAG